LIYFIAFIIAAIVFYFLKNIHLLLSTFIADIAATLVVWFFGVIFKNSSVYDPYWSLAPPVILILWLILKNASFNAVDILFIVAITLWSIRLTLNWAIRWRGLADQDWRYTMLKKRSTSLWFFTNLIGINLVPTLFVFAVLIPVYYGIKTEGNINFPVIAGFIICISAILIEYFADRQMNLYKKQNNSRNRYIDRGLWQYSRHPNYFGEVLFWWGIWLIQIGIYPKIWLTVLGPVMMTALFLFISIPLMEKHVLQSKKDYITYQKQVSIFIPWFRRSA
jgi:steroid 5-alpha reductase family enzyme